MYFYCPEKLVPLLGTEKIEKNWFKLGLQLIYEELGGDE